jgi:hypothetical protein
MESLMLILIFMALFIVMRVVYENSKGKRRQEAEKKQWANEGIQQKQEEKICVREAERILKKHDDLVQKCFEILERKVSVIDDYGEENWSALPEELNRMGCKIAEREGLTVKNWAISVPSIRSKNIYSAMSNIAAIRFRKYHEDIAGRASGAKADVKDMSGVEFETHIVKLLSSRGYEDIAGTPVTGDQGADILAKKDGRKIIIQAKRSQKPVGNKAVQEVTAALRFYGGDEAWVVTNAAFTPSARALAHKNDVRLIDGTTLATQAF